ncbi:hypothetical protein AgCh_026036 [Apium graveolens]
MARLQQTQRKRVGSVPRLPVDVVAAIAAEVLKKADMVRKNVVESILAERDILIAVQNPFAEHQKKQPFYSSIKRQ